MENQLYSYIMGLDEELWDILEDGVGDLDLDEEGADVDRKKHTPDQKEMCNALLNYLIILLGDIVYSYILYAF